MFERCKSLGKEIQYNDYLYNVPSLVVKLVKLDNGALLRERERDDNSS